jgi:hypothetical protein
MDFEAYAELKALTADELSALVILAGTTQAATDLVGASEA